MIQACKAYPCKVPVEVEVTILAALGGEIKIPVPSDKIGKILSSSSLHVTISDSGERRHRDGNLIYRSKRLEQLLQRHFEQRFELEHVIRQRIAGSGHC